MVSNLAIPRRGQICARPVGSAIEMRHKPRRGRYPSMRIVSVSLAVGLAACAVERPATTPIGVSPAPALRGDDALALIEASPTLDGPPVGPNPGGGTLVVVFASWCEHCRD